MKGVARIALDKELHKILEEWCGDSVIDIGGKNRPYKRFLRCKKYVCIDINPENNPDIVADAHNLKIIENEQYDLVLATEILEHCHDPKQVISEFQRIIKQNGTIILSTPFLYPYHPDPKDYYRYTIDGLQELCKTFKEVKIIPCGNRFLFMWEMITWRISLLKIANRFLANIAGYYDKNGAMTYITVAKGKK